MKLKRKTFKLNQICRWNNSLTIFSISILPPSEPFPNPNLLQNLERLKWSRKRSFSFQTINTRRRTKTTVAATPNLRILEPVSYLLTNPRECSPNICLVSLTASSAKQLSYTHVYSPIPNACLRLLIKTSNTFHVCRHVTHSCHQANTVMMGPEMDAGIDSTCVIELNTYSHQKSPLAKNVGDGS